MLLSYVFLKMICVLSNSYSKYEMENYVAILTLGSRSTQGLAKVWAKSET
jgi:hypothetical protein